eukprot:comp19683_c0_seq1/m.23363 comp19683_c0_seq1/g.23363  ORF comp19683_c0_seq1/g.23363 comp19683_c0_seq1/m.23363 type:complete len:323 (-) comp19683_c0_seq1:404-1372(-)
MARILRVLATFLALGAALVAAGDKKKGCPFLEKGTNDAAGCPVFGEGCPFKKHECPFKDKSHEDIVALIDKCPHLKDQLAKCPKYNPEKEGCPFSKDGKMDVEKCPFLKGKKKRDADDDDDEKDLMKKYKGGCPYLDKQHHVPGCPAFKEGCPFKEHECPFKDMSHEEAVKMMHKCPHLKEHLEKCPKYKPDQKEGCPFEHEGEMDVSKCPHFKHHVEEHDAEAPTKEGGCPFAKKGAKEGDAEAAGCPFAKAKKEAKRDAEEVHECPCMKARREAEEKAAKEAEGTECPCKKAGKPCSGECAHAKAKKEAEKKETKAKDEL